MIRPTPAQAPAAARWSRPLAVLLAAIALCWAALVNGQPFFHPDTQAYVRGPDVAISKLLGEQFGTDWARKAPVAPDARADGAMADAQAASATDDDEVLAGRSLYYGLLAYLGQVTGGFWPTVLVQGLAVALVAEITLRAAGVKDLRAYGGAIAGLALVTPASLFVSLLMPDVWAGIAIVALASLFAFGGRLRLLDVAMLGGLLVFAAMAHNSHLLIIAAVTGLGLLLWAARRFRGADVRVGLAAGALAMAAAVAGTVAFNAMVERTAGKPPITPPFLTARVIEDGPGARFVKERCREGQFEVCRYAHRLPLAVDDFLWVQDPEGGVFETVGTEARRRLSEEQARFALAAVTAYPLEQAAATTRNVVLQLTTLELKDFTYKPSLKQTFEGQLPESHLRRMTGALAWAEAWPLGMLQAVHAAVFCLAGLTVAWLALRPQARVGWPAEIETRTALLLFTALIIGGVLANGTICGALSALHGRYQARVAWALPLVAMTLAFAQVQARSLSRRMGAVVSPEPRSFAA